MTATGAVGELRPGKPYALARSLADLSWLLVLCAAGVAVTWFRTVHLQEASALYGFQPTALIDPVWYRPEFAADFPNGEAETLKSLFGQAVRIAGLLPLSKQAIVSMVVFAEFAVLAGGVFVAVRSVNRDLPGWMGVATALLLTTGACVNADLARWFHPFYGSAYNFAYGLGLLGFAAILRRSPIIGGAAIGVGAAIHPIISLFFGLAMAVAALVDFKNQRIGLLFAGAVLAAAISGTWAFLMLGDAGISAGNVDPELFVDLSRMMGYHWFPVSLGMFGQVSYERLLPLTGFMVLFACLAGNGDDRRNAIDRQIAWAVSFLLAVSLAGVLLSEYSGIPVLIKSALHRASLAALMLAAVVVVPRLFVIAAMGAPAVAFLAAVILLETYWRTNGVAIGLCLAFAGMTVWARLARRETGGLVVPLTAVAAAVAIMVAIILAGWPRSVTTEPNIGLDPFMMPLFLTALAIATAARYMRQPALLAGGFLLAALPWTTKIDPISNPAEIEKARSFLEVQQWARAQTPTGSLFMTDPGHDYGWREHSERPSFGTAREWLYSGWIYDTRADVMTQGLERANALGLDVDGYLQQDKADPGNVKTIISSDASHLYHAKGPEWFASIADRYGVRYFVLELAKLETLPLPVAFANDRYVVIQAIPSASR